MLLASRERSSKKGMEPSRWKRFSRKLNPKSVEKASEFAISNTYSTRNEDLPGRLWRHAVDLGTCEQTEYHDDVYEEAQELVNDWLDNKLQQELASDGEGENAVLSSPPVPDAHGHMNYDKFDAQELVNDWLDNKLQQELASDGEGENAVLSSPPVPDAHGHMNYDKFDDLCGYLEEEEESATAQKFIEHLLHKEVVGPEMVEELGRQENQGKRQQKDPRLTMEMRHKQCQKRYFSAWHKLILDHRIKLGKAGTLSDWKLQLKVLRAWRDHTRTQKLERETQALENDLREENRKQQLATEFNRKQVLRYCFSEWQRWHGSEVIKRELARAKEQTRKKMDELLKAASLGKLNSNGSLGIHHLAEATAVVDQPAGSGEVTIMPTAWEKLPMRSSDCILSHSPGRTTKGNFQGPLPNVSGSTADAKQPKTPDAEISEQPGSHEKPETTSQEAEPVCVGHFHNRHVYQQQLIEKQKKKLKEQQKTIQKLKENQRLAEARWAAERAASVTEAQSHLLSNPRGAEEPQGTCQRLLKRILAERKKKQEEDKLAQLKAQEEERQKKDAEEKEAQLERKREEKRLKKMKELENQKRIKRNQELEAVAKDHYEKVLLRKKGLEPWKRLRMQSKQSTEYVSDVEKEARKLCVYFLQKKFFRAWLTMVRDLKTESQRKLAIAAEHCDRKILSVMIQAWKAFVKLTKEERVREERRGQLRRKVADILPDFQALTPL
ncbi:coiled-coil domain containing 191 [Cricetulus griseus]